jgi:hypothetical protein
MHSVFDLDLLLRYIQVFIVLLQLFQSMSVFFANIKHLCNLLSCLNMLVFFANRWKLDCDEIFLGRINFIKPANWLWLDGIYSFCNVIAVRRIKCILVIQLYIE